MALLGELYYKPSSTKSWYNLPRERGVAYAAQECWVLNKTVRENIVFKEDYNEKRYKQGECKGYFNLAINYNSIQF